MHLPPSQHCTTSRAHMGRVAFLKPVCWSPTWSMCSYPIRKIHAMWIVFSINKSAASWHELHNIQTSLLVAHLIGVVKATQCGLLQVWASFKRQILRIRITNANSHSVSCLFSGHAGEAEMKRGQKMNLAFTCTENISRNLASNYMESEKFNCHAMEDARVAAVEKLNSGWPWPGDSCCN